MGAENSKQQKGQQQQHQGTGASSPRSPQQATNSNTSKANVPPPPPPNSGAPQYTGLPASQHLQVQQQQQQQQQTTTPQYVYGGGPIPSAAVIASAQGGPVTIMSPTHQQQQQYYQPQTFQQPISLSADQILTISFHFQRPPLGKGGFSTVYEGEFCGYPVAVKILTVRNQNERALFEIELAVLCNERLRHRNLLPLIGFCHERPALVMPRLKPLNKDRLPRLPGSVRMLVAMDVARGLAHLHQAGFVHNDMKPDNVLLEFDENRNIVRALVGDLGCAKVTSIPVQPFGTMLFMDPQLNPHGPPVLPKTADDVYSFALTVVCIFTNSFPENQDDLARMWATIEATFPLVANLARRMTQPDWRLRPSCAQAEVELKQIDEGWRVAIELQKAAAVGATTIQSPPRSQSALQQHTQPQQQLQPQHHSSALQEHRDRMTEGVREMSRQTSTGYQV